MKFRHLFISALPGISALFLGINLLADEPPKIIHTAKVINDVRIEIVSIDENGAGEMRITGDNCQYCDREFWFDFTTTMRAPDYIGRVDAERMKDMFFVTGSVRVMLGDNWIDEVRYVEVEE